MESEIEWVANETSLHDSDLSIWNQKLLEVWLQHPRGTFCWVGVVELWRFKGTQTSAQKAFSEGD